MGVLAGSLKASFYFRVRHRGRTFETATFGGSLSADRDALARCYPGAVITALNPQVFAMDGLPWFPGCESPRAQV